MAINEGLKCPPALAADKPVSGGASGAQPRTTQGTSLEQPSCSWRRGGLDAGSAFAEEVSSSPPGLRSLPG